MFTPERVDHDELLDEHDAPRPDMERSLRDLRRINRWLGGISVYRRLLRRHSGALRELAILDVGAGTADLISSLPGDAMRIALDFKIDHLLYLRDGTRVRRVVGDALRLPFRKDAVDVVTSSHFFHHFDAEENTTILSEGLRVARKGVMVTDTVRSYVPLLLVRLLAALRLVGRITRFDAPASVLRGYTKGEAQSVASKVAAKRREVVSAFPYRFAILLWK
ncbi:MAG TPA: methyltransferase domain-containing protein [Thermoanaerobaculia bacterium]|jgi:ubiquinone/menaquinone biosynthesis C-methylase UbiE|nr:methyltransferase domain-containing protein [Thermoanaerobaculia bacterium]